MFNNNPACQYQELRDDLAQLKQSHSAALAVLATLLHQGQILMLDVAALTDQVAQNTSITSSALTLIQGLAQSQKDLAQQLADAIAANDPVALAAAQEAIDASVKALSSADTDLAAAVAANTVPSPASPANRR